MRWGPRGPFKLGDVAELPRTVTVFVNRRSGMAHRRRDCETLKGVPDGALRIVTVEDGLPRFRFCSRCSTG
jgi:hypothetical protein